MTKKESIMVLFSITLCWSSSYIFIKDIPQDFSVYAYLALTSGVGGILLALVMRRKLLLLNGVTFRQGLILGALITASNMFEKLGLDRQAIALLGPSSHCSFGGLHHMADQDAGGHAAYAARNGGDRRHAGLHVLKIHVA